MGGRGRNQETLGKFFDQLGERRAALLTHVSCDGAEWIHALVRQRAPQSVICLDPFHVVAWALKALDRCGCAPWRQGPVIGTPCGRTRKNPADLTGQQRTSLAEIAVTNHTLYRAYLLKEQLREVFRVNGATGRQLLAGVAVMGVALAYPGVRHARPHHPPLPRSDPQHTLDHGVSNARSEATNTHLRALTKRAYGFTAPTP